MESSQKRHKDAHVIPPEDIHALYRAITAGTNNVAVRILAEIDDPVDLRNIIESTDRYITWWANYYGVENKPPFNPDEWQLGRVRYIPIYQAIYTVRYGEQSIIPSDKKIDYFWLLLARYVCSTRTSVEFLDKPFMENAWNYSSLTYHINSLNRSHVVFSPTERTRDILDRTRSWLIQWFEQDIEECNVRHYEGHGFRLMCRFRYAAKLWPSVVYRLLQLGWHLKSSDWNRTVPTTRFWTIRSQCISCETSDVAFHVKGRPNWTFCNECAQKMQKCNS